MNVIQYITEEVRRQRHNIEALDGVERVGWMLGAWSYAVRRFQEARRPVLQDVEELGRLIEPDRNRNGVRKVGVRIGMNSCPPPEEVMRRLERLLEFRDEMTPLEFYREFETIHPFVDGNGRAGKVLYCWLLGQLLDPVFPPPLWETEISSPDSRSAN